MSSMTRCHTLLKVTSSAVDACAVEEGATEADGRLTLSSDLTHPIRNARDCHPTPNLQPAPSAINRSEGCGLRSPLPSDPLTTPHHRHRSPTTTL